MCSCKRAVQRSWPCDVSPLQCGPRTQRQMRSCKHQCLLFRRTFFTGSPRCLQATSLLLRLLCRPNDFLTQAWYHGSLFSFLVCLLAPLDIMLKTSLTLCAFLALWTGPPVLKRFLLHSGTDVDNLNVHALQLNLTRILVQIDPFVLPHTVHCIVVKSCCHRRDGQNRRHNSIEANCEVQARSLCSCDADAVWTSCSDVSSKGSIFDGISTGREHGGKRPPAAVTRILRAISVSSYKLSGGEPS